jgi:type VI secretion system secreted protein Hcp
MAIEGAKQGNITAGANTMDSMGNKYQQDHADESTVLEFKHEIIIPKDPQSGQPTGQRMHQPAVVRKRYDKASPLLYNALCSGERLSKVTIKWYRTSMEGTMEHYFTHELEDALLLDMKAEMGLF